MQLSNVELRLLPRRRITSELSDTAILGGVLGLAQTAAYLVFCISTGAPAPVPVVAGVVLGVAVATACLTRTVEATQLTPVVPLAVASSVLWLVVAGLVFHRAFRWEPRA